MNFDKNKAPRRGVVRMFNVKTKTGWRTYFTLVCGHHVMLKRRSIAKPPSKFCNNCANDSNLNAGQPIIKRRGYQSR